MGYFTWKYSDNRRRTLPYGGEGYIILPDDTSIHETHYDGYGNFDGHDVYEVVVDMNKDHLKKIFAKFKKKIGEDFWGHNMEEIAAAYQENNREKLFALISEMAKKQPYIREDWKRTIGITLSCGKQNEYIPYPLKIASTDSIPYAKLKPAISTQ